MPKQIEEIQFSNISKQKPNELVTKSFNSQTTLDDDTRLVIVGTLTPPCTRYFYCAPRNRIFGYIDEALEELGYNEEVKLKELKKGLSNSSLPKNIVDEKVEAIKTILRKHKIAFLDVMNNAIRKNNKSHDDENIEYYTLATDDFRKVNLLATIIVNSRLAEKCFAQMNITLKSRFLSQRSGLKVEWLKAIKEAIK